VGAGERLGVQDEEGWTRRAGPGRRGSRGRQAHNGRTEMVYGARFPGYRACHPQSQFHARQSDQILYLRLHTAFEEAYLDIAPKELEKWSLWVEDGWTLPDSPFRRNDKVAVVTAGIVA